MAAPMPTYQVHKGECWDVSHPRKGNFTARFESDVVDMKGDGFCKIKIIEGMTALGAVELRTAFLQLRRRREDLEKANG